MWHEIPQMATREFFSNLDVTPVFYPPPNVKKEDLAQSIKKLLAFFEASRKEEKLTTTKIVSLQDKIKELTTRLTEMSSQNFGQLAKERTKGEVVVMFLAVLHLLRERLIQVEQGGQFSDIILKKL